jgi:hypothetical protein
MNRIIAHDLSSASSALGDVKELLEQIAAPTTSATGVQKLSERAIEIVESVRRKLAGLSDHMQQSN